MSRYIDAEVLYRNLHEVGGCGAEKESWADGWDKAIDEAIRILNKMPTANVVKIVRCKDCKYYRDEYCGVLGFCEPDEFCSRGERRKDDV